MEMFRVTYHRRNKNGDISKKAEYKAIVLAENIDDARRKYKERLSFLNYEAGAVRVMPACTDVYWGME